MGNRPRGGHKLRLREEAQRKYAAYLDRGRVAAIFWGAAWFAIGLTFGVMGSVAVWASMR